MWPFNEHGLLRLGFRLASSCTQNSYWIFDKLCIFSFFQLESWFSETFFFCFLSWSPFCCLVAKGLEVREITDRFPDVNDAFRLCNRVWPGDGNGPRVFLVRKTICSFTHSLIHVPLESSLPQIISQYTCSLLYKTESWNPIVLRSTECNHLRL